MCNHWVFSVCFIVSFDFFSFFQILCSPFILLLTKMYKELETRDEKDIERDTEKLARKP